jgi:hypothetical protein
VITFVPNHALREENSCHNPGGPGGGRFCGPGGEHPSDGARAAAHGEIERATPERFKASLEKNARAGTLSDYTLAQLGEMQLFMVKGYDAGYAIKGGNELVNLYNSGGAATKGAGPWLVIHAIEHGVTHGDHYDGFLSGFYKKLGFTEVKREKNWTEGGPDVVYIEWHGGDRTTARARYGAAGRLDAS